MATNYAQDILDLINGMKIDGAQIYQTADINEAQTDLDTLTVNTFSESTVGGGASEVTITVTGSTYTPTAGLGSGGSWGHRWPNYGTIQFSSNPGVTYKIIGFSEDKLLLSTASQPNTDGTTNSTIIAGRITDEGSPTGVRGLVLDLHGNLSDVSGPVTFSWPAASFHGDPEPFVPVTGSTASDVLSQLDDLKIPLTQVAYTKDIDEANTDSDTLVVNTYSSMGGDVNDYPITMNVVDTNFIPGSDDGTGYTWPIYGTVTLSNTPSIQWKIIGFSEGKLLLYSNAAANTDGHAGEKIWDGSPALVIDLSGQGIDPAVKLTFETEFSAFCFAEGTRIETPEGPVAVENLVEGQLVLTASGAARPVRWIGQLLSRPARHRRPWEVQPVCVKPHAFGPDMPAREVRLSPGHAVYVDGVLVPVGHLVNGATIVQEAVERVRYFHVELETHDLLVAEGLPCESYLDDGNRQGFRNAGEFIELHGRLDPQSWDDACAPLVAAGPQLVEIQEKLHARAGELGWVKSEQPDLRLAADGVEIMPQHRAGNRYWFAVPAAAVLELRSGSGVLAQLVPGIGDGRRLGVAVAEIRVDGETIDLDDAAFGRGFYPAERHEAHGWRWTDGNAELTRALAAPAMVEVTLAMVAPHWIRPAAALRVVA